MKKIVFLLILIIGLISCSKEFYVDTTTSGSNVSKFTVVDFTNKKVSSNEFLGNDKPTLVVVAAEWCPHCRVELPEVERFYTDYKDKVNVVVIFSQAQSSFDEAKNYYESNGFTFPAYYDNDGVVLRGFGISGFPYNMVIESNKFKEEIELPVTYESLQSSFGI